MSSWVFPNSFSHISLQKPLFGKTLPTTTMSTSYMATHKNAPQRSSDLSYTESGPKAAKNVPLQILIDENCRKYLSNLSILHGNWIRTLCWWRSSLSKTTPDPQMETSMEVMEFFVTSWASFPGSPHEHNAFASTNQSPNPYPGLFMRISSADVKYLA